MSTLNVTTIIPGADAATNADLSLDGKGTGKVAVVDDATVAGDIAVTGATTLAAVTASGTPTFSSTDNMSVGGNIVLTTAAKGIYLGVTGATAANLLDDYETGTWTCTLGGSTTNPTSAVTASFNYTKIGNLVYLPIYFAGVNTTGAAGGFRLTGLPFTPSPGGQMTGTVSCHTGMTVPSGTGNIAPYMDSGTPYISFYATKTVAGWEETTHNATGAMWLNLSVIYRAA